MKLLGTKSAKKGISKRNPKYAERI